MLPATPAGPWEYRCVAFDLDGILVDTEPYFEQTVRELLEARGKTLSDELAFRMLGTTTRQAFEMMKEALELLESIEDLSRESVERLFALFDVQPVPLMPGVWELLDALEQRGVPKCIATSSHREHVDRVLAHHGILHRFAFVMTCEDVVNGKPFPEIYEKTAQRFGQPPGQMVVIEDSANGLRAAQGAGARCIVVPHSRTPIHLLDRADAMVPGLNSPAMFRLLGLE